MIRMNECSPRSALFSASCMNGITASSSWKSTPFAFVSATGRPCTVANLKTGPWTERIVR